MRCGVSPARGAPCHCLPRPRAVPTTGTRWPSLPSWRQAWIGGRGDNSGVTHAGPLWGHREEQWCQLPRRFLTQNACMGGDTNAVPLPPTWVPGVAGGQSPRAGGHPAPRITHSASPDLLTQGMLWQGEGLSRVPRCPGETAGGGGVWELSLAWPPPLSLKPPPALGSGLQHPWAPPVHPWGALALQTAAGATAKPLHWPRLGGRRRGGG